MLFLKHSTRVCAGWSVGEILLTDPDFKPDRSVYLIARGKFFAFVGFMGLLALSFFIYFKRKRAERAREARQVFEIPV